MRRGFLRTSVALGAAVVAGLMSSAPVWAVATSGDLFYTRFSGADRVKKVAFTYDGVATFTLGAPMTIAGLGDGMVGADGIAFDPNDGKILIGAQTSTVHKIDPVGPVVTSASTGGPAAFHLAVDPGGAVVWVAGIPGDLSSVPIGGGSFGAVGTPFTMAGDDLDITQLIFDDDGDMFYTSSGPAGTGAFGTIAFSGTTATTTRLLAGVPAAHGGAFDPFLGDIVIYGDEEITQIDPDTGLIVSTLDLSGLGFGLQLDQGAPDGLGHSLVASNTGELVFVDYSSSALVGDVANFVAVEFLDTFLDDVAPLVGPGAPNSVPEPTAAMLGLMGGIALCGSVRRRR